jgi:hypothetical protein
MIRSKNALLYAAILLVFGLFFTFNAYNPAPTGLAAPAMQFTAFPTPTPGPDGRILYTVQQDDTLFRIAAVAGMTVEELMALNNLDPDDIIRPGDVLLLGLGGPSIAATETPAGVIPTVDPASLPPTPTSGPGTGTACVFLYDDLNGDSTRQDTEVAVPDGAISLSNRSGTISFQGETIPGPADPATEDPPRICFEDLLEGEYIVSVAIPEGYNPTTSLNTTFNLLEGDITYIDFGAQRSSEGQVELAEEIPEEGGRSPLLGIVGGLLLLAGVGLAVLAGLMGRGRA